MRVETSDAYASELLHSARYTRLSSADHALLTELMMGVLRWRSALDNQIEEFCAQPLAKLDREVLSALRLGAYQLLFLDRIPAHAAINESVELVKQARKKSAAGMVNAVLRKMSDSHFSQMRREVGHPMVDYRSTHPKWIVDRWDATYGGEIANKICRYDQVKPYVAVRVTAGVDNQLGIATNHVGAQALPDEQSGLEGIRLEPGKLLSQAALVVAGDITRTLAFGDRRLVIQDEASQLIALLVGTGTNILDCCAAPGGKTRIIAERNPEARVVAMELHPHRAQLIRKLVREANVIVIAGDARHMPFATKFDCILVDAPCSGTGTLARNPEIKWRLKPEDIFRLQQYQIEILSAAMSHVAEAGQIVYSTCSLEPEENEEVVEKALAADPSFHVVDCKIELRTLRETGEIIWTDLDSLLSGPFLRTVPGVHPCDGFFAAILRRS